MPNSHSTSGSPIRLLLFIAYTAVDKEREQEAVALLNIDLEWLNYILSKASKRRKDEQNWY
ncbi:hypothetical protein [Pseudoalteromonas tunicata]|uniref:hypothetical protein n=1 Tax=Pseudoalteromonas tunicata TaxID=314281 RepID=UPI00273DEAFE|nr:hypothetical protein [Pseudoalteromonas tunicata]MDP4983768.1 hypothetical protein [Pseudoalteromonas tunicata]